LTILHYYGMTITFVLEDLNFTQQTTLILSSYLIRKEDTHIKFNGTPTQIRGLGL